MSESPWIAVLAVILVACCGGIAIAIFLWHSRRNGRSDEAAMTELTGAQADAASRLEAMIGMLAECQSQLAHSVNERLDSDSHRLGDSLEKTKQSTAENLQKLNERLPGVRRAQKKNNQLSTQVTSLQAVLANKQERGAFGQGRMELIV